MALVGLWRTPTGLLTGTVALGVGVALATPAIMMLALDGVPTNERGSVMGTVSMSLDLAFGLGPATLGLVAAATGRAGLFLAAAGVGVGLPLAVAAGALLRSTLYGISPTDPLALAGSALVVTLVAALASYLLGDSELQGVSPAAIEVGLLARYDRPPPTIAGYDRLLTAREAVR